MGMTPLEGLVMGTRSGDIDPAVLAPPAARARASTSTTSTTCSTSAAACSGSAGTPTCATSSTASEAGDAAATLALEVYVHRLRAYVGAYLAQLGGVDVISFTAGVGENAPRVARARARGARVRSASRSTAERNEARARERAASSRRTPRRVAVLVVPTNEELEIARQTLDGRRRA